ncbi:MAG: tetratricopeptide repeat protein, partial [Thermoleophilaceae bacterium]
TPLAAPDGVGDPAEGAALNDEGKALIDDGRPEEAVPVLQEAVQSFPEDTTDVNYAYSLFNLGNALRLAGRPDEAIPVLERRLEIPNQRSAVREELELARTDAE